MEKCVECSNYYDFHCECCGEPLCYDCEINGKCTECHDNNDEDE